MRRRELDGTAPYGLSYGMHTAYLTRKVRFAAAHRYHRPEWSDERNRRTFGSSGNAYGHGHNYVLAVTVKGEVDRETGFCTDLGMLDDLLRREVTAPLDHRHINHAVDAFGPGGRIPTTEEILIYLWPRIARGLPDGVELHRLRLHEDDTLYSEYYGEGEEPRS